MQVPVFRRLTPLARSLAFGLAGYLLWRPGFSRAGSGAFPGPAGWAGPWTAWTGGRLVWLERVEWGASENQARLDGKLTFEHSFRFGALRAALEGFHRLDGGRAALAALRGNAAGLAGQSGAAVNLDFFLRLLQIRAGAWNPPFFLQDVYLVPFAGAALSDRGQLPGRGGPGAALGAEGAGRLDRPPVGLERGSGRERGGRPEPVLQPDVAPAGAAAGGPEAREDAMKSHEGNYEGSDGRSLFYRSQVPLRPAGVVLLLHGYAEHSGRYEWVMERLAEAGFAVYAPDHRGFGAQRAPGGAGRPGEPGGRDRGHRLPDRRGPPGTARGALVPPGPQHGGHAGAAVRPAPARKASPAWSPPGPPSKSRSTSPRCCCGCRGC